MDAPLTDRLGRPVRDLRISVTDRCNFRCPYCMPSEVYGESYQFLARSELLSFEEITRLARLFIPLGVEKIRITGGEPLLRADLERLIAMLAPLPGLADLTLTTNGHLLERQVGGLKSAGLSRLTVSLDSLDPDVFRTMAGRDVSPDVILAGIAAAERVGFSPIKINCVVERGVNDHTLADLARHFRGTGHVVRFIEFMDVGTLNGWDLSRVVAAGEILEILGREGPLVPIAAKYTGEVARRYAYADGSGEIGIIASVTAPFCGNCSRARLSTRGELVTCLFANGGVDLRTPLRNGANDAELTELIERTWAGRTDRYSEERGLASRASPRIEMFRLGG